MLSMSFLFALIKYKNNKFKLFLKPCGLSVWPCGLSVLNVLVVSPDRGVFRPALSRSISEKKCSNDAKTPTGPGSGLTLVQMSS